MDIIEYDNLKDFFADNFDFENYTYFYHMTNNGVGEQICTEGLLMVERSIYSTAIKIEKEDIEDIDEFLNLGSGEADFRQEMVIICCEKESENSLVKNNFSGNCSWSEEEEANFIVSGNNVIGYISLCDKCFHPNTESIYAFENYGINR